VYNYASKYSNQNFSPGKTTGYSHINVQPPVLPDDCVRTSSSTRSHTKLNVVLGSKSTGLHLNSTPDKSVNNIVNIGSTGEKEAGGTSYQKENEGRHAVSTT
jgi:hypothetical protein